MRLVISSCLNSGVPVKPIKAGVRQRKAHVARQPAGLCAMRLVRDHNDVVALAVGLLRIDTPVELVDQAEDVTVVLLQQLLQVVARRGPRRLVVGNTTANEGLVKSGRRDRYGRSSAGT